MPSLPALAVLATGLAQSTLLACLPWLIARSGLSAELWSWLLGAGLWLMMLAAPWWGRLVDLRGGGTGLLLSFGGVTLALALLLAALWFPAASPVLVALLLLSRLLHSLFMAGVFPAAQWLSLRGLESHQWRTALARLSAVGQLGRLLGPALVAALAWWWPPAALLLLLALSLWLLLQLQRERQHRPVARHEGDGVAPWGPALPSYLLAGLITTALGLVQFSLGPLLQERHGLSAAMASALMGRYLAAAALAAMLAGLLVLPRLTERPGWLLATWWGLLGLGGLAMAGGWLLAGVLLLAAGLALATPWYGARLRERWPGAQGLVAGRLSSLHTLGYGLGMVLGGRLLAAGSWPLAGLAWLGPLLAGLLLWQWALERRTEPAPA
ncbi:MFS transporter [Gallaecimonas sp. GXIMD4217]|uniref:MFS transporter n=1 Tax=Gallaecimonas sp. GXIMD4217 TaxID=3131927 RepID=UPI00311B0F21